jgi:NAD(P)-dependent dehydrogenase (short-subunit alcohol dehydrogenase family)
MTTTLITGANKSLGLETARRLLEAGHTVYAGMRDVSRGDAVTALGAHPVQLDVSDQASVDTAFASLPELDVLVNNAGVLGTSFGVDDLTPESMEEALDTNVVGIVRVTQAALPLLRRSARPASSRPRAPTSTQSPPSRTPRRKRPSSRSPSSTRRTCRPSG